MIFSFNKVFKLFSEIVKILSMNRMLYRGVLSLIGLIIYFGVANNSPVPAVIMIAVLSISVAFWVRINPEKNDNPLQVPSYYDSEFEQRRAALSQAKIFLAPYKNMFEINNFIIINSFYEISYRTIKMLCVILVAQ